MDNPDQICSLIFSCIPNPDSLFGRHYSQIRNLGYRYNLTIRLSCQTSVARNLIDFCFAAGQERYHSLAPMYYRGAQAAIVVYDITNQDTFGRAKVWVKELQRQASPNIVIALAGNKADLAAKRAVEFEEAKGYAEENGLLFMETSAKTAMNVNDIFLAIGNYRYTCCCNCNCLYE